MEHKHLDAASLERLLAMDRTAEQNDPPRRHLDSRRRNRLQRPVWGPGAALGTGLHVLVFENACTSISAE
jgi:hypothetical protein